MLKLGKKLLNLFKNFKKRYSLLLFICSLIIFTGIFILLRLYMNDLDEYDHLTSGYFMKSGKLLYKDFFSHHFPLPYYWTFIFTPLWSNLSFSRTISIFRLEILVMYLITFVSVFVFLKNKISRFVFSSWIILLSTFFIFYLGNMVLSETFSAIFISGIFWIVLPIILGWEKPNKGNLTLILLFASAAFWTQPLLIVLFVIPFLLLKNRSQLKLLSMLAFSINIIPFILFFLTKQLSYFIEEAVWFNFFVYPKFYVTLPGGNMDINPFIHFFQNELSFFTKFTNNFDFFQFIVHLAFIALFVLVLKSRKWRYILCYLLIFLAVRSREVKIFTGTIFNFAIFPFLAIASGAFCILLAIIFRKNKIFAIALFLMIIVVNSIILTPLVIGSFKSNYNYHVYWSQRQHIGEIIQKLSTPEKSILIYPYDIDLYYFAQRYPPDRFTYWYPWIDEVDKYRQERLNSLKTNPPEVIYIGNLYFKGENNYYMRYFPNLLDNYIPVMKNNKPTGVWIIKENQNLLKDINLK